MNSQKRNQFHELLLSLRQRVGGEVNHVVQSLQEEVYVNENQSAAPVHLADIAVEGIDADMTVLQTERGILDDINTALGRIADGTYGKCIDCGKPIAEERLKALPYTPFCVACAQAEIESSR